ncbi:MAG: superoxide dismutase [Patescibacteria group bacterium]
MHTLPSLDYGYADLEPYFDEETMRLHHGKHHQSYIDKLNQALENYPELAQLSIKDLLIKADWPEPIKTAVGNHGGGHYNHSLFWQILAPAGQDNKQPTGEIGQAIEATFGSFEEFKNKFSQAAMGQFGSGWAWLTLKVDGQLQIETGANQFCPLTVGRQPLFNLDVWEHAYYLKYRNRRSDYIDAFWPIVNWEKVNEIYLIHLN